MNNTFQKEIDISARAETELINKRLVNAHATAKSLASDSRLLTVAKYASVFIAFVASSRVWVQSDEGPPQRCACRIGCRDIFSQQIVSHFSSSSLLPVTRCSIIDVAKTDWVLCILVMLYESNFCSDTVKIFAKTFRPDVTADTKSQNAQGSKVKTHLYFPQILSNSLLAPTRLLPWITPVSTRCGQKVIP